MIVKQIEIRDRATFIPALAFCVSGDDGYLMRRAGFGRRRFVCLYWIARDKASYSPFTWDDSRTFRVAHQYLVEHWDKVNNEDVIDVEFILGEKPAPSKSERESAFL